MVSDLVRTVCTEEGEDDSRCLGLVTIDVSVGREFLEKPTTTHPGALRQMRKGPDERGGKERVSTSGITARLGRRLPNPKGESRTRFFSTSTRPGLRSSPFFEGICFSGSPQNRYGLPSSRPIWGVSVNSIRFLFRISGGCSDLRHGMFD